MRSCETTHQAESVQPTRRPSHAFKVNWRRKRPTTINERTGGKGTLGHAKRDAASLGVICSLVPKGESPFVVRVIHSEPTRPYRLCTELCPAPEGPHPDVHMYVYICVCIYVHRHRSSSCDVVVIYSKTWHARIPYRNADENFVLVPSPSLLFRQQQQPQSWCLRSSCLGWTYQESTSRALSPYLIPPPSL